VWIPSEEEQKDIVSFLDQKCNEIGKAIKLQNEQIAKLKEYKTSLINAAVTGKIKVG
jgi:type I restriction enzyme S subunit